MVGELRERTGAGLMNCKKALVETSGNFDEAIELLRKKVKLPQLKKRVVRPVKESWILTSTSGARLVFLSK